MVNVLFRIYGKVMLENKLNIKNAQELTLKEEEVNIEITNQLIEAILNNAIPTWTDEGLLAVGIATVCASLVVAFSAYRLNNKQIFIATKQAEIANKQSEIMEQQNKIALFEKRIEVFLKIKTISEKIFHTDNIVRILNETPEYRTSEFSYEQIEYNKQINVFFAISMILGQEIHDENIKFFDNNKEELYNGICLKLDNIVKKLSRVEYLFVLDDYEKGILKKIMNSLVLFTAHAKNILDEIRKGYKTYFQVKESFVEVIEKLKTVFQDEEFIENLKKQVVLYEQP